MDTAISESGGAVSAALESEETGLARTERLSSIFGYGIIIVLLLIQLAIMWPR
jgi:hypothetical protein